MSQARIKLGCCDRSTSSTGTLNCQYCKLKYHLSCLNVNKVLKDISEEDRAKWMCPGCSSKLPKLDNTNTPIRSISLAQQGCESTLNINTRRGGQVVPSSTSGVAIDNIRQAVREELSDILEQFKINLIQQFDFKIKELLDSFNLISDSLTEIQNQQEIINNDVKVNSTRISELESENTILKNTICDLNSRIIRIEQHSRASNLEIQNIPEYKSENLFTVVKQIANITNCKVNDSDILLCTRVAKLNSKSPRPRSVILKFASPRLRDNFLAASINFNKKAKNVNDKLNTSHIGISGDRKPIFVVEHLSPTQKAIHAAARSKAKELNYRFVWVKGGRVFMRKTETSEYIVIKNIDDLSQLN
ncbi:uncharacterized protein LOC113514777 [Galleria mellonella]|uniref:Uncharacterized protein LOC113514777 n=1 Tax=Galleria mellonella TaxID=7137 RepID=A0ABM3N217_GALME|nr:uncharacterized protein LOC113514777 [Galleria mellonella]